MDRIQVYDPKRHEQTLIKQTLNKHFENEKSKIMQYEEQLNEKKMKLLQEEYKLKIEEKSKQVERLVHQIQI